MTITYALDENTPSIGDVVLEVVWKAYQLGLENNDRLNSVLFSGCEKNKNFYVKLEIEELL